MANLHNTNGKLSDHNFLKKKKTDLQYSCNDLLFLFFLLILSHLVPIRLLPLILNSHNHVLFITNNQMIYKVVLPWARCTHSFSMVISGEDFEKHILHDRTTLLALFFIMLYVEWQLQNSIYTWYEQMCEENLLNSSGGAHLTVSILNSI